MKKLSSFTDKITGDAPLAAVTLKLALPAMGTMYLISSFNFIDTKIAGELGATALAALSTGQFFIWSMIGLSNLIAIGIGAVIARRIGEGNRVEAQRAAYQGLIMSLMISLVFGTAFWLIGPWVFSDVMRVNEEVTRSGLTYLYMALIASPMIYLAMTSSQIFQAIGDTRKPMWFMALALVIHFLLDYTLILGKFGAPSLGIAGAGVAIIGSRTVFVVVALYFLFSRRNSSFYVRPHSSWNIDWGLFKKIFIIGLPTAAEGFMFPVVYMLLTRYTTIHGTEQIAALRVGHTIEGLVFFGAIGMGIAMRPLVGQNLGAGNVGRARKAPWMGAKIIFGPVLALSALMILKPEIITSLVTSDPAVIQASAGYLRIVGWSQVFMAVEMVFVGAFAGAGVTWTPMAIVFPLTFARWPIAALTQELGMGIEGVWWTISVTSILKGILVVGAFSRGSWVKKKV
jgi:putative MATE family efflux protein